MVWAGCLLSIASPCILSACFDSDVKTNRYGVKTMEESGFCFVPFFLISQQPFEMVCQKWILFFPHIKIKDLFDCVLIDIIKL